MPGPLSLSGVPQADHYCLGLGVVFEHFVPTDSTGFSPIVASPPSIVDWNSVPFRWRE